MRGQATAIPLATAFALVCSWWACNHQQVQAASAPQAPDPADSWLRAVAFFKQQSPTASFPQFVVGNCAPSASFQGHTIVLDYCNATHPDAPTHSHGVHTQRVGASVTFHAARASPKKSPPETEVPDELTPVSFEECSYFVYHWTRSTNIAHTMMNFVDALGLLRWLRATHGQAGHIEVEPDAKLRPYDAQLKQIFNASFGTTHPPDACFLTRTQTSDNHLSSPTLEHANYVRSAVRGACGAPSGAGKVVLVHRAGKGASARNFRNAGDVLATMMDVFPAIEVRKTTSGDLCEQCLLYADARIVVSPHGQQLTNLWCMQQGTVLIEFFPWLFFHPLYQFFGTSMGLHVFGSFGEPISVDPGSAAARHGFDTARCSRDAHCRVPMRTQMITANITHFAHVLSVASRVAPPAP